MRLISVLAALTAALLVAGCNFKSVPDPSMSARDRDFIAQVPDFELEMDFQRYEVDDPTGEKPGTIVVDTSTKHLYYVLPNKRAVRYGVATGAEAYGWKGTATIRNKAEWPHWTPPADMVQRWPHLRPTAAAGGLNGGPDNPLGARALYLYDPQGRDTLYRIHGTNEPETIGRDASSGCIRMRNVDVIDLYTRVAMNTKVIVK
jgi:lipoprotein-anchoring transpeptidase ErfK/SrfK